MLIMEKYSTIEEIAEICKEKDFTTKTVTTNFTNNFLLGGKNVMITDTCVYLWMCELQKWLRDKYNIDIDVKRDLEVHYNDETRWIVTVSDWNDIKIIDTPIAELKHPNHFHFIDFKSYEQALEEGLKTALTLI